MSYDFEIGTHAKPADRQLAAWAAEQDLAVARQDGDGRAVIGTRSARGARRLLTVEGPFAAGPDDLAEAVAAACLAPRWMMTVSVPYSSPKRAMALGRSLARHLAQENDGAAFDPQADGLIWPRSRSKRVSSRRGDDVTSRVTLKWFLATTRWEPAPATLLRLIRRRCPEALPARYGRWEPPSHRFDPDQPGAFVRFVLDEQDGDGLWFAARPSFGGSWSAPHAERFVRPEDERLRIAALGMDFDGRVLDEDPRWREAVVDFFAVAAAELGAFFAAAQVEPGWTVTTGNRLRWTTETMRQAAEHVLRGRLWQGLPPVPMWLSWFGDPYRELVASHLTQDAGGSGASVERRATGIFVRRGSEARPAGELGGPLLPAELTYRYRPPVVERPDGSIGTDPARPGDEAPVIPRLG